MQNLQIIIPERMAGIRIDSAIAQMLLDFSRSKIADYIKSGKMLIDGNKFMPKDIAKGKEIISFSYIDDNNTKWLATKIAINVVFEDSHIMIIDKPAGLVTHPGAGNTNNTLANGLLFYNPDLVKLDRAGIVHRLDKNTSGLMVVAKTMKAQKYLTQELQYHRVIREYRAVVYGNIIAGATINEPIARDSRDRKKQTVSINGKEAITNYRVIKRFANHTYIKILLQTGRTHQIRVHMSHIGYPLVGDFVYGGRLKFPKKANDELKKSLKGFNRQALHSAKLELNHPITGQLLKFESSIAEDIKHLLDSLQINDAV